MNSIAALSSPQRKLRRIPQGFIIMAPSRVWPVVSTPILSLWGKLRMAAEFFVPCENDADESLADFASGDSGTNLRPAGAATDRGHLHGRPSQAQSAVDHAAFARWKKGTAV